MGLFFNTTLKINNQVAVNWLWAEKIADLLQLRGWLRQATTTQLVSILDYRAMYNGQVWGTSYLPRRSPAAPNDPMPMMIEHGVARLLVDVCVGAMFGQPLNWRCGAWGAPLDSADQRREEAIYRFWAANNGQTALSEAASACFVDGDVYFVPYFDPATEDIALMTRNAVEVFPRYSSGTQMNSCDIVYPIEDGRGDDVYYHGQYYFENESVYYTSRIVALRSGKSAPAVLEAAQPVDTGLPFIPVVRVPNQSIPYSPYGTSDLAPVASLVAELARALTDLAEARSYAAFPITVVRGYGLDIDSLKVEPGAIWEIPAEGGGLDVITVPASFFDTMSKYIDRLYSMIQDVAEIPAIVFGDSAHLRDTSGVALETLYAMFAYKISRKQAYWSAALEQLNVYVLRMKEIYGLDNFNREYENHIVWPPAIPRPLTQLADTAVKLVGANIWSPSRAMDYTGVEDADKELERVRAEKTKLLSPYNE